MVVESVIKVLLFHVKTVFTFKLRSSGL